MTDSVSTNSLYRALRSAEADPDLAHAAVEAVTNLAGQNVIDTLGARIDTLGARIDTLESRIDVKFDAIDFKFDGIESKIDVKFDGIESKIDVKFDVLRRDMDRTVRHTNRLNTVLVGLLGAGVIGGLLRLFLFAGP